MDWSTIPALAVVLAIAAAIGFVPLMLKRSTAATIDLGPLARYRESQESVAHQFITESVDVECPHEATFLAVKRAFDKGQYEVCRKLLEAAIEQKGAVDA